MNNFFNQYRGIIYASITALLWGFLSIVLKVSLEFMSAVNIAWFRFLFAFLSLFIYYLIFQPKKLAILKKPPLLAIIAALGLSINYLGFTTGIHFTSPNTAQVVMQIGPILLGVVGFVVYKERINRLQMLGFTFAFVGLSIFYLNQIEGMLQDKVNLFNKGFFWVLAGALGWLLYASLQKHLVKFYEAQLLNLIIFALPTFLFIPFVDFTLFYTLSFGQWLLMIFLGLNTIIAYGFLALAFKYTQVNKVSVVITLNPIITFLAMTVLFYLDVQWVETSLMGVKTFGGALLVIFGAIFVIHFRNK
ncbi:MAG: DMT family transporter [Bacteroidales bacterium]|jgi:drug/metabolite transporter (DMT)-like permease|nr:DMT family transporter [Bacteroidales bacterium]